MKDFVMNWCKIMFTQNSRAILVRTASCQNGALKARGIVTQYATEEMLFDEPLFTQSPLVELHQNTICLNRREASFVNKEVRRLLKTRTMELARKKKEGIPLPPEPGKIAYAVYQ